MRIYDYDGRKNICGDRVREARIKQRITQEDLAARLQVAGVNIERNSVSRLETGNRFVSDFELLILSQVLNVNVEWLLSQDETDHS